MGASSSAGRSCVRYTVRASGLKCGLKYSPASFLVKQGIPHEWGVGMVGRSLGLALFVSALGATNSFAADKPVEILTLEWPPYTAAALPDGGATTSIVRKAFEAAGYQVTVRFLPWKRAVDTVANASNTPIAFFPGYNCNQTPGLMASDVIGDSLLGFAQNTEAPLVWSALDDLKGKSVGTVLGYSNTPDFDAMTADGRIRADVAAEDVTNMRKLVAKRIDAAVIDKFVLEYLRKKDAVLSANAQALEFNAKPLQTNPLYVCARDDDAGRRLIQDVNGALKRLDIGALTKEYFDKAL